MNITVYLKKMSGDILTIIYDSSKEKIEDIIKRDIMAIKYKGYYFNLFKDGEYYNSETINLKDGDVLDFFIGEKNFKVNMFFIEEALMYKSKNDNQAWIRSEFYKKIEISILEEYKKNYEKFSFKVYDFPFYVKGLNTYIPSSSIEVINKDLYDDEEHIILLEDKYIFSDINSLMSFILRDMFEDKILEDINNEIKSVWDNQVITYNL